MAILIFHVFFPRPGSLVDCHKCLKEFLGQSQNCFFGPELFFQMFFKLLSIRNVKMTAFSAQVFEGGLGVAP